MSENTHSAGQPPLPAGTKPADTDAPPRPQTEHPQPEEIGGPQGPEPTRYGDWERKGRCIDF